jgi:disulfide bond formation protein DsbB
MQPYGPAATVTSFGVWLALGVTLAAAAGSLVLSMGLGLVPCPLCFYQRSFALGLTAVLGLGLLTRLVQAHRLALLALPLAVAGLGVAGFHVSLEVRGRLECPAGLLGLGTAPQQSLAMFSLVSVLLLADVLRGLKMGSLGPIGLVLALALGGGMAWASCNSNPPLPLRYDYDRPPNICRPPRPPAT